MTAQRAARRDATRTPLEHAAKHTADMVRMHRSIGTAKRPERVPAQIYPHMIEQEYAKVLAGVVRVAAEALQPLKDQLPAMLESARAARGDDASDLEVSQLAPPQTIFVSGLAVVVENAAGSVRRWSMPDGTEGSTIMRFPYGYIAGVTGADGDELDAYVGPDPHADGVGVVRQMRAPDFQEYDEDKVMLGFPSSAAARDAYLAQYTDPGFFGGITWMSLPDFKAAIAEFAPGDRVTHIDAPGDGRRARQMIDAARSRFAGMLNPNKLEALAEKFGKQVTDQQRAELSKQVKAALGVDIVAHDSNVPAMLEHFTAENVSLIRRIPARLFDDVEAKVTRAFAGGTRHEELAADIQKSEGTTESAARLIARDQIGKLNGQVNASRQQQLGIGSFTWRTVGDERVRGDPDGLYPKARPSHYDRDDQVYTYDDPPHGDDGPELPGEPINCRCTAEPVFDDILDQIDPEGAEGGEGGEEEGGGGGGEGGGEETAPEEEPSEGASSAAGEVAGAVLSEVASEVAGEAAAGGEAATAAGEEAAGAAAIGEAAGAAAEAEPTPEIFAPRKNPKRVEAARTAGLASAERRREIMSAVKSNLPAELHLAWDKEGSKFLRENGGRIKGIKDRINAASTISQAFAETYGSGEASVFGNEGDRYFARQELESKHAEEWADSQERAYYEQAEREAREAGDIDESGELTEQGQAKQDRAVEELGASTPSSSLPDDPPF